MFQVAVAGPPLTQNPSAQLITDSLWDFLHPETTDLRFLVPVVGGSLSTGVQAVIEWAWEKDIKVAAVYEQSVSLTAIENQFLEDADETIHSLDAAQTAALILKQGLPNACLMVAPFGEEYDAFTRSLMSLCFEHEIPVYDLSQALMEVDPYDAWENEGGASEEEEKAEEQPEEVVEETAPAAVNEQEMIPGMAALLEGLEEIESQADSIGKAAMVIRDRARVFHSGQPVTTPGATPGGIEISYDGEQTWEPRKRGRARKDSVERDAVTKEIIRRN